MKVADTTVLVTGANRGLGRALVEETFRRGAMRVYVGTRQPFTHSDGRDTPLTLEVTNAAQVQRAVEKVGSLDILINTSSLRNLITTGKGQLTPIEEIVTRAHEMSREA